MELGYNYIEMWEYDWNKSIKAIIKIQKIWKNYFKKITKCILLQGRISPVKKLSKVLSLLKCQVAVL